MNSANLVRRLLLGTISGFALAMACSASAKTSPATGPAVPSTAAAPITDEPAGIADIVVTAQKRSQSINSVGISVVAATGSELLSRGITNVADLAKIVPGFTFTPTAYATPVYTLRGVGLYDSGISSSPAVSVYVDQVAISFPSMTTGASLDLERVEVLKGPQGTLFGQNSTGGAINYIAAKPTKSLESGGSLTYERFGKLDVTGYISGPLSDTVRARLAVRAVEGGAWQYSVTRPNDTLGASRQLIGRFLLDWDANEHLTLHFNANGYHDRSDTQQPQFQFNELNITKAGNPANPFAVVDPVGFALRTDPTSPAYESNFLARQATVVGRLNGTDAIAAAGARAYLGEPKAPNNARAADWNAESPSRLDNSFGQLSVRADYSFTPRITLTSITAGEYLKTDAYVDLDATPAQGISIRDFGSVRGFSEELRLAQNSSRLNWVVGASYDYQRSVETQAGSIRDLSSNENIPGLPYYMFNSAATNTLKTYAGFGNVEYKLTDTLSLQGAVRYTENKQNATGCSSDPSANQNLSTTFDILQGVFKGLFGITTPVTPVGPNQCYQFTPDYSSVITPEQFQLNQHNVSWRAGLTNKFENGVLIYANASRGYKSGVFTPVAASYAGQFAPAGQERLDAYEIGFKGPLLDHKLQFNAAGFYYNYADKQLRSRLQNLFGTFEKLINVPESRVWGVEAEIVAQPMPGLLLTASGTYLNSRIRNTNTAFYNQPQYFGNFAGSELPFTPNYSGVADAQYSFDVSNSLRVMVGASLTYQSTSIATFETAALPAPGYTLPSYALLDLRAGISAADKSWSVQVFGRNVTNKYYYNGVFQGSDTTFRYAGRPVTYGVTMTGRFR